MDKCCFLKKDQDFKSVYRNRKTYGNRNFTLYIRPNHTNQVRIGFSISKKVGNAVVRNRIKRRLKMLYRDHCKELKPGYDLVLVVKNNVADLSFPQLKSAFIHIMRVSRMTNTSKRRSKSEKKNK